MTQRADLQYEMVIGDIVPAKFEQFRPIDELLGQVAAHEKMLKSNNKNKDRMTIPPTIRNNNTLYLIEKMVNKEFAGGIEEFVKTFKAQSIRNIVSIRHVIISGQGIEEEQIIDIIEECALQAERMQETVQSDLWLSK